MTKDTETQTAEDGQIEMTAASTPLYESSEKLIKAKAQIGKSQLLMEQADEEWCEEMKKSKLTKINHKGDTIQLVTGRTTKDHSRFVKQ